MYYTKSKSFKLAIILIMFNSCDKRVPTTIKEVPLTSKENFYPKTDFYKNIDSVNINNIIKFNDNTTNKPTEFFWTFLGGTPNKSIDQNPQIKYSNLGLYNVKLVTKNQYGSDSLIKQNYVKVFFESNFDTDFEDWTSSSNWYKSTSSSLYNKVGLLAYSQILNTGSGTSDLATLTRTFNNIPENYLISFWYYIYSPKGTLNLKLNEKSIFLTSGFGQGVAIFPMKPGNNVVVSFEATLYPTSSIYLTNFKLIPKP